MHNAYTERIKKKSQGVRESENQGEGEEKKKSPRNDSHHSIYPGIHHTQASSTDPFQLLTAMGLDRSDEKRGRV
jgi:hypothetical protein